MLYLNFIFLLLINLFIIFLNKNNKIENTIKLL
jgi:hypothetical protein